MFLHADSTDSDLSASMGNCPEDPVFLHADSEDSDQTGWMPRLI